MQVWNIAKWISQFNYQSDINVLYYSVLMYCSEEPTCQLTQLINMNQFDRLYWNYNLITTSNARQGNYETSEMKQDGKAVESFLSLFWFLVASRQMYKRNCFNMPPEETLATHTGNSWEQTFYNKVAIVLECLCEWDCRIMLKHIFWLKL